MTDEPGVEMEELLRAVRAPVAVRPEALAATKTALRAARPGRLTRLLRWWTAPRPVLLSPLRMAAGLGLAVLATALALRPPARDAAPADPGPGTVRFVFVADEARAVAVVGDFNDWDARATPLRPAGAGGVWVATVSLPRGRYAYSFVVDGERWASDPTAPPAPEDDFGRPSSVLLVSGAES